MPKTIKSFYHLKQSKSIILMILIISFSMANIRLTTSDLMKEKFEVSSADGYFQGYNLFVLNEFELSSVSTVANTLYLVDMEGEIILQKPLSAHSTLANIPVEFFNSTTLLYGDLNGANFWNFYTDEIEDLDISGHHDFEYNSNNNSIFTLECSIHEIGPTDYLFDKIYEYDLETGAIIWEFSTDSFITFDNYCPFQDMAGEIPDITHANTLLYDVDNDMIYLNCRNTNSFLKINHKTGELMWSLGEEGNFTMRDINGNVKEHLFFHGHALEMINENTFILFDNDKHNQTDNTNMISRMIEISIDETTFTANVTWEYAAPKSYHSGAWGDSDRLPNLNRFGTFGTLDHAGSYMTGAILVEVDPIGNIVWEMKFFKDWGNVFGIYQCDRIRLSPIIEITSPYWIKSGEEAIVNWQAFYNFRNKHHITGNYDIVFESEEIENGIIDYGLYWQPVNKSVNLGYLDNGNYNLTITLDDGEGHKTIEIIELVVSRKPPKENTESTDFHYLSILSALTFLVMVKVVKLNKRKITN